MVILQFKQNEKSSFLYETTTNQKIDDIIRDLIALNNVRVKLDKLITNLNGLIEFGPLRPEALRGLTQKETYDPAVEMLKGEEKKYAYPKPGTEEIENPDKTGYRTGIAPSKKLAEKIQQQIEEIKKILIDQKCCRPLKELEEQLNLLRGAVMIVYPAYHNLPDWDPVYLILEDKMDFQTFYPDANWLEEKTSTLWWAKKELKTGKILSEFVGKNEKTKLIVKIAKKGQGAPLSEPMVDSETQKKMMSYYYKKQEEQKKLEENEEDNYLEQEWANPKNLKNQLLNGGREIGFRQLIII